MEKTKSSETLVNDKGGRTSQISMMLPPHRIAHPVPNGHRGSRLIYTIGGGSKKGLQWRTLFLDVDHSREAAKCGGKIDKPASSRCKSAPNACSSLAGVGFEDGERPEKWRMRKLSCRDS
jgi:hypothetical protein